MDEPKFFLLEVVVDKIFFNFGPIPQKKQIVVHLTCGTFLDSEIRTDVMGALEVHERDSKRMDVDVCCGRSFMFSICPKDLKEIMITHPLKLFVSTKLQTEPIGCVTIKWGEQFLKLVTLVEEEGDNIRGVHSNEFYSMKNIDENVGRVEVFHRLSYHGKNVDTQIQLVEEEDGTTGMKTRKYYFKGEKNKTMYVCSKYGLGSDTDLVPVAPIYKTVDHVIDVDLKNFINQSMASLRAGASLFSIAPSVFRNMSMLLSKMTLNDSESVNPLAKAKLFTDIQDLIQKSESFGSLVADVNNINYKTLTVEKIEKLLCNNPDCPAAKKFKDYGIGPLAKGKGLGGLYKNVEPPVTYGMSQTYGNLKSYGPLGTLKKLPTPTESEKSTDSLKSEEMTTDEEAMNFCAPLRLTGGSPDYYPNPIHECKDLMQQFNDVLDEFKHALGPCGEATCPFAQNLVDMTCRKVCHPELQSSADNFCIKQPTTPPNGDISACGVESCPYNREIITPCDAGYKKKQMRAACGSPQCPFTREKVGLEDYDDVHMPKISCLENCPYGDQVDLPPIHWDCPDPLPKDECKNPDCPIVRKSKLMEKYFPHPSSPCGSPTCPYSVVACTFPHCPFSKMEPCPSFCPYAKDVPKDLDCAAINCPFSKSIVELACGVPTCPYNKQDSEIICPPKKEECENPSCPYKKEDCGNEACPYRKSKIEDSGNESSPPKKEVCGNEACPYGKEEEDEVGSVCSVHNCPFLKKSSTGKGDKEEDTGRRLSKGKDKSRSKTKDVGRSSSVKKSENDVVVGKEESVKGQISKDEVKKKKRRRKRRKKRKTGYVYDQGTYYPGNKIGHRECVIPNFNVPRDMGWLWNVHTRCLQLRPRRGWKPGAIGKTIAQRINEHRKKYGLIPIKAETTKGHHRKHRGIGGGYASSSSEEDVEMKPTLQVKKKNGVVYVTMNPLKDPKTLEDNENPYMDCTPMQFKIVNNKPQKMCYCDELGGEGEGEDGHHSEDSSELDIEFTPPAGVIRPSRLKRKKNVCHVDVQYDIKDVPPLEPPKKEKTKGGKKKKGKKEKK